MTNSETTISAAQVTMDENDLGMTVPNRKLCDQVRDRIHDFEGRTRKEIVEIGALLIQVKGAVGHGAFKKWLDAEVRWTIRTAENYMNVAKNIGDKYETVSQLPLATVYALAGPAVSDQVRQKVFATIADPANPPSDEIKKLLGETRGKAKAAAKKGNVTSVEVRGTTSVDFRREVTRVS
ncbi:MAG: DUF3102 domain-containing protein, partial [Sideroxyarcus sp.]|nr:DUF3102 domain-containing protein [Sideroxyarcus sp.]